MCRSKWLVMAVSVVVAGMGSAWAGTLNGVRAWAERAGTNNVASYLGEKGIADESQRAALAAAWDEDVFVETALTNKAFGLILHGMTVDKYSPENMKLIKAAMLAGVEPTSAVAREIVKRLPVGEREDLKVFLAPECAERYPNQPEFGRLYLKYTLIQNVNVQYGVVDVDDLIRWLVAPEVMSTEEAKICKQKLKDHAVRLARLNLRAEGKTFVMKDGVNPLMARVQPVIDALNAPAAEGLEAAFGGLGMSIPNVDRSELKKVAEKWAALVMSGDVAGGAAEPYLTKIVIALGADGFNRFVDEYNNGRYEAKK